MIEALAGLTIFTLLVSALFIVVALFSGIDRGTDHILTGLRWLMVSIILGIVWRIAEVAGRDPLTVTIVTG